MSSLYYQHRQHQQQQQRQREREQLPNQQQQHHDQDHPHRYDQRQHHHHHQSQSYSEQYHYHEDHRYAHSHPYNGHDARDPSFSQQQQGNNHHDDTRFFSNDNGSGPGRAAARGGGEAEEAIIDTLWAMLSQERSGYDLDSYFPGDLKPRGTSRFRQQNIIHGGWREKICQWSYNVVDHFDLPREIVSISLNFFDRYMATLSTPDDDDEKVNHHHRGSSTAAAENGSGDLALLASLGTLHLATKVHATNHNDYDPSLGPLEEQHHKVPSLNTLANLSRGQFGPASILEMEKILLGALRWRLHPPTLYAFVSLLLKLVPTTKDDPRRGINPSFAVELFEAAMYIAELSVCDAYFVERQIPSGTIALAAICTAMDDLLSPHRDVGIAVAVSSSGCFTERHRAEFLATCANRLGLGRGGDGSPFASTLERLRSMYLGASVAVMETAMTTTNKTGQQQQRGEDPATGEPSRSRAGSYNPPTSPSSIADMSLSTINSTIHSMTDTNGGGGGSSLKRGDSMVSSIACQSRETTVGGGDEDDDYEIFDTVTGSSNSDDHTNFRYSPSPPRDDDDQDDDERNGYRRDERDLRRVAAPNRHPSQHSSAAMSCSPIVALR